MNSSRIPLDPFAGWFVAARAGRTPVPGFKAAGYSSLNRTLGNRLGSLPYPIPGAH